MPDQLRLIEALRENEEVLARCEVEAHERRQERIRLARDLIDAGFTQQSVANNINEQREAGGARPITVDAIQKALVRAAS